jgi:membrane-bound metal-dependent hydrolase YbcI (DUF457 family)
VADNYSMLLFAHLGLALATARFIGRADLAFLALGSMLPDIIDKPLGLIAFGSPNMGRTFAHTLLFLLLLAALSFYTRDIRLISLSWGVLIHLALDHMWNSPVTLLWPLLGIFPEAVRLDTLSYLEVIFSGLRDPGILVPELLGLSYLIYFAYMRRGQISAVGQMHLERPRKRAEAFLQTLFRGM